MSAKPKTTKPKRYRLITANDTRITGIKEMVPCVAYATLFDKNGKPDYDGGSTLDWDGQRPMTWGNDGESLIYVDDDGEEWCMANLERVEDEDGPDQA